MAGEKTFTQIPPSSTGKRILLRHAAYIPYINKTGNFTPDKDYTGASSGLRFVVNKVFESTLTTGTLEVIYDENDVFNNLTPIANENILDINLTPIAQVSNVSAVRDISINTQEIVGANNPTYGMNVDVFGAAAQRFTEGRPQIAAAGQLRAVSDTLLSNYIFDHGPLFNKFSNSLRGDSTVTYDSATLAVKLQTDTANDNLVTHTSDFYHPFIPGASTLFLMAARSGDSGKAGVIRRWGPFDPTDGFFFELNGTTLYIVHRYTFNGVKLENKVEQSIWNGDSLDGSGDINNPSGLLIDITKNNQYWYDYQFLGGGRARWGIFDGGGRIICHTMNMSNGEMTGLDFTNPISIASRPVCWSQYNSGSVASPSQLYALGATVFSESETEFEKLGRYTTYYLETNIVKANIADPTYMFSIRPNIYLQDGTFNRSYYLPKDVEIMSYNSSSVNDDLVRTKLKVYQNPIMRGVSYSQITNSTTEVDRYGDVLDTGNRITTLFVDGNFRYEFSDLFKSISEGAFYNKTEFGVGTRTQAVTSVSIDTGSLSGNSPNIVRVGNDPVTGNALHHFEDTKEVSVSGTGTSLDGNDYYLSLTTGNETWMYNTTSSIYEDRKLRTLYVDNTGSLDSGDIVTVVGYGSASVQSLTYDVSSGTGSIALEGRTSTNLDVGSVIFGTEISQSTTGVGTVFYIDSGSVDSYPKDYKTSLNAVTGIGTGTGGQFRGNSPVQPTWMFDIEPISKKPFDINNQIQFGWLENIQ